MSIQTPMASHMSQSRKPSQPGRPRGRRGNGMRSTRSRFLTHFATAGPRGLRQPIRLVWFIIWSHVDATTGLARLSYQALEEKTGLGIRQAKRVVQALLERGYLRVVERGSAKCWACNVYRVFSAPSEPLSSVIGDSK